MYCQNLQGRRISFPKRIGWLDSISWEESTNKIVEEMEGCKMLYNGCFEAHIIQCHCRIKENC